MTSRIPLIMILALASSGTVAKDDRTDVLAVADAALAAINQGDAIKLTDLMFETGATHSAGIRDGKYVVRSRTWAEERALSFEAVVIERGFDPTAMISGPVAVVWYPYDLYVNGRWSHCGVDVFSMLRSDDGWKISAISWSVEQPPQCKPHPDGPPGG